MRHPLLVLATACTFVPAALAAPDPSAMPDPGSVLSSRDAGDSTALHGASTDLVIEYASRGVDGEPVVVSGQVSLPAGDAPDDGWPVLSWAHGTTGVADACAPSASFPGGPEQDYVDVYRPVLERWLDAGYAVVQTDYLGLGSAGLHPYMNYPSEVAAITDIVRAARRIDAAVGSRWVVMGHSQGGAATLFAAQEAPGYAPELDLVAGIALAPGGVGLSNAPSFVADAGDPPLDAVRFLPILMLGVEAARPDLGAAAMMSDDMTPYMDLARTGCLGDLREAMAEVPASVFRDDADVGPLVKYLDGQDPMRATPKVPVLVVQGGDDALVARPDTESLVDALCDAGAVVRYELLPDADHRGTITGAPDDALDFARAVREGDDEGMPGRPCT